ncbi:cysteine desulfurase, SufS subfamily [Lachnospiraceae bacterium KM106-2]|nr:cysteine desulfurase, SufS subfamily [Lachnospiraceae bacterium KM106-2]
MLTVQQRNKEVNQYQNDFPYRKNSSIIYLDNAATTQKPDCVLRAVDKFYKERNANPFRGLYELSYEATKAYETARKVVQKFIGAPSEKEIIFTRNTTESLNLVAYSYGLSHLRKGDEIVVSIMEHHSNLLPWQMVARQTGAKLRFLECDSDGIITEENIARTITRKTKLIAITQVSNVLGRVNPIRQLAQLVHRNEGVIVVDAAQSILHHSLNVELLDSDFIAFSGHKMLAPMGIGVLYGRQYLLEEMPPFLRGGEMIERVTRTGATFAELPHKFEAGTVNAADAVGLAEAIRYLQNIGYPKINLLETKLMNHLMKEMKSLDEVHIIGAADPSEHCGIVTFTVDGVHPHDVASILNEDQIAVRAGHHCAQPLLDYLGVPSTVRASICFYNSIEEIDRFLISLSQVRRKMGYE